MSLSNRNSIPTPPPSYQAALPPLPPQSAPMPPASQHAMPRDTTPAQQPHPSFPQAVPLPHSDFPASPCEQTAPPKKSGSIESWIGRNVLSTVAAILVFLGLIFLGFLIIPSLDDVFKIASLFAVSIALTIAGTVITKHGKNAFTLALLGCGCGSLFISIILSHAFFHLISDVFAFGLLLVWLAGVLVLVKFTDSLFMSIIAHLGMIISLCFAYAGGLNEDRIVLLTAYQILSIGLITAGNIMCYRKTYRAGLLASLALCLVTLCVMTAFFAPLLPIAQTSTRIAASVAMVCQVVCACILSFLLYQSVLQIEKQSRRFLLHVLNKLVIIGVFFFGGFVFPLMALSPLFSTAPSIFALPYIPTLISLGISFLLVITHMIVSAVAASPQKTKAPYSEYATSLELISIISLVSYIGLLVLASYFNMMLFYPGYLGITGLLFIAAALLFCSRATGREIYHTLTQVLLGVDLFFMLAHGYATLSHTLHVSAALVYLGVYLAYLVYEWKFLDKTAPQQSKTGLKLAAIGVYELSLVSITSSSSFDIIYALLAITGAFIIMYATKIDISSQSSRWFSFFILVHAFVLIFANSCFIGMSKATGLEILPALFLSLMSIILLIFLLIRAQSAFKAHASTCGIVFGISLSLLILASVDGLTHMLTQPYVFTITLMATALICVITGFSTRIASLRLYGLIAILICVLRLVTIDIDGSDTLLRVIAFIGGGIICFGISALYNYAVKRFEEEMPA